MYETMLAGVRHAWSTVLRATGAPDTCGGGGGVSDDHLSDGGGSSSTNALLWTCVAFGAGYWLLGRILRVILLRARFPAHSCAATVRYVWAGGYHAAAAVCLTLYYHLVLAAAIKRDNGPLFPMYASALEMKTVPGGGGGGGGAFEQLGMLMTAFHVVGVVVALNARDGGEAVESAIFALVLRGLQTNGLENFTILLNIWLGIFQLATAVVHTVALHSHRDNVSLTRFLLALRLLSWCYVYLHLIPFDFLLTAAASRPHWLNGALWLWYGTGVWMSPVLHFGYHRVYQRREPEQGGCTSGGRGKSGSSSSQAIARCVLVRRTPEYQHYRDLQRAYVEIRMARQRTELSTRATSSNTSARTYQTLKCMLTLKKKLKRIREANAVNNVPMLP